MYLAISVRGLVIFRSVPGLDRGPLSLLHILRGAPGFVGVFGLRELPPRVLASGAEQVF